MFIVEIIDISAFLYWFYNEGKMSSKTIIYSEFSKEQKLLIAPELRVGFPSPAEEYLHDSLDFNRDLLFPRLISGKLEVKF